MPTSGPTPAYTQLTTPDAVTPDLRTDLIACWIAVTNAGGAVGFPFPPVGEDEVAPVADALIAGLAAPRSRLLVARLDGALAGWLQLSREPNPLIAHWGTVRRLQTHPRFRGCGFGGALIRWVRGVARDEMGLRQLRLAVRGGLGLEGFYERLGWREVGRWPRALRLADGDERDEVLMLLDPL